MYINTETNEYPLRLKDIRQTNPNVSLPKKPDEQTLNALGYATVQTVDKPVGDVVTEGTPVQQADGSWLQVWETRNFTTEELTQKLSEAQINKKKEINRAYEDELNAILKDYPEAETKTWDKQEAEARAWAADNTVATPMLTEIATARGLTMADLAPRVIAKADAWIQLSGAATGKRQALEDAINVATTLAEVEAITW